MSHSSGTIESILIDDSTDQYSDGWMQSRASGTCPLGGVCSRIEECPKVAGIVANACLKGDSSMFCGNIGQHPLVCCPIKPGPSTKPQADTPIIEPEVDCGKSLIYGPQYNGLGAFPFVARIGFKNVQTGNTLYPCTGSILSKRVILTAAHCALAKADGHKLTSVKIGDWDTATDPDCANAFCARRAINHAVSHIIVHPGYQKGIYSHDVALLVLRTPLNYSVTAQSICLYDDMTTDLVNIRALLVGWGKMAVPAVHPSQQQNLAVPIIENERCNRLYSGHVVMPTRGAWLCAGGEPGGDACQGFGGAPLVLRRGQRFVQVGMMSFGSDKCGAAGVASVYTRIAYYAKWIRDNMPIDT
ncbi:phenoloxidase-activating factor 1-like [Ctenocephalides felis]|uniref:phenoloxidase-activating factor 1-like n=1 Tax=Ctenocephalides felis TaxID=7515 RepID=UPI000E6E3131|nr:phenoloxidase-activating factor 1-like [Ctenocephalides felis]